ncbi:hypothetical protein FE633_12280 [Streptomyces montanus]|uniref:Uncharacterized protein n=1 Tax=Streptomyces montanus TaxID=2580423 RepID=A0A5R9FX56_9ACTN|nr:hypothetical protein [Streptomyces montanus]TLS45928.1 hypothetical protein FE633_12280 [Streptomyces montanus]
MRTEEFLTRLDDEMLDYFREMVDVLMERFNVSRAEAVARINERYAGEDISGMNQDFMCHEMPEFWAYHLYFKPTQDARPLPSGDPNVDGDLSEWEIRPLPPKDSPVWTLQDESDG